MLLQLRVMVPFMHAFDHDLDCQLENSGLYQVRNTDSTCIYDVLGCVSSGRIKLPPTSAQHLLRPQDGVGHRVGEQSEQEWSLIKPFALIARYMTPAHWWQGFNLLFELLARVKQAALPELLDKKMRNMHTAIGASCALHSVSCIMCAAFC